MNWKAYREGREYISERIIPRERFAVTRSKLSPAQAVQNCDEWKQKAVTLAREMVKGKL